MESQYILNLEQEYYGKQERLTKREWLDIFPEARQYLEEVRNEAIQWISIFENIVRYELENIPNNENKWFWEEIIGICDGAILDKYENRLKEADSYSKQWPHNAITEAEIEKAKDYPFELLIKPTRHYKEGYFMAKCPFHNEQNASLLVKNKFYYCFGCQKSGDTINFIQETEGLSFKEAVHKLA
jgi:hypothetical protein